MPRLLDLASSFAASVLRLGLGFHASAIGPRPAQPLQLYEFEACPFCRKVREALSMLDLEVVVYPCPKGSSVHRKRVLELGGREQFPFLVDPNTGTSMYESSDIIEYLYRQYGDRPAPWWLRGNATLLLGSMASAVRLGQGGRYQPARRPDLPLVLASFEISPYCRIAREALSELELPYHLINVAKRSPSRPAFVQRSGRMMVPWLYDPNTGTSMFESADIRAYLYQTYANEPR